MKIVIRTVFELLETLDIVIDKKIKKNYIQKKKAIRGKPVWFNSPFMQINSNSHFPLFNISRSPPTPMYNFCKDIYEYMYDMYIFSIYVLFR